MRPDSFERTGSFHPGIAARIRADDALKSELAELGADAGSLVMHSQRAWASTSFSGTRHRLVYTFDGEDAVGRAENLIATLPTHEFTIPHQLVADADVTGVDHRVGPRAFMSVMLELLLLDEG